MHPRRRKGDGLSNNPLLVILKKLEEKDKKLNDIKDNIKMLAEKNLYIFHDIQLQDAQINH